MINEIDLINLPYAQSGGYGTVYIGYIEGKAHHKHREQPHYLGFLVNFSGLTTYQDQGLWHFNN